MNNNNLKKESRNKMKTANLTRVALLLALLIISSRFAIPIGPVAISLQTLIVLIIGLILPTGQAVLTTTLYLLLGLLGLPIFTQAMGGPYSVLQSPQKKASPTLVGGDEFCMF